MGLGPPWAWGCATGVRTCPPLRSGRNTPTACRYRASGTEWLTPKPGSCFPSFVKSFRNDSVCHSDRSWVRVLSECCAPKVDHTLVLIDCIIYPLYGGPTLLAYQLALERFKHGFMAPPCMPACYSTLFSGINRRSCMLTRFLGKERYSSIQRAPERNTQVRPITYSITPILLLANNDSPTRASMSSSLLRDITAVSYNPPRRKRLFSFPLP